MLFFRREKAVELRGPSHQRLRRIFDVKGFRGYSVVFFPQHLGFFKGGFDDGDIGIADGGSFGGHAVVAAGEISLRNGMICQRPMRWEERDGKLWFDTGIEGEAFGEKVESWVCAIDEEGFFTFMTTRYVKED